MFRTNLPEKRGEGQGGGGGERKKPQKVQKAEKAKEAEKDKKVFFKDEKSPKVWEKSKSLKTSLKAKEVFKPKRPKSRPKISQREEIAIKYRKYQMSPKNRNSQRKNKGQKAN